jgi:ATP adenylyltransferase
MRYIQDNSQQDSCPFCAALNNTEPAASHLIHRGEFSFVILNRYPYTTGHALILPNQHVEQLAELDPQTRAEMAELINKVMEVLKAVYNPEGFNVGLNMGSAAGAGIPKHLHWHIVPRWVGDTNYMSTVGEVRVLPEELEVTYQKIKEAW